MLTADEVKVRMTANIAELLDRPVDEIDPAADFGDYGLDSADAVLLAGALEEILDREVEPTILLRHRTLTGLIDELTSAGMVG